MKVLASMGLFFLFLGCSVPELSIANKNQSLAPTAITVEGSKLGNFVKNMKRYENQNINIVFDNEEWLRITSLSYEDYFAIEEIAGYTRYVELTDSNFIVSKTLITDTSIPIKNLQCRVIKSDDTLKFHFHKYVCDIKGINE